MVVVVMKSDADNVRTVRTCVARTSARGTVLHLNCRDSTKRLQRCLNLGCRRTRRDRSRFFDPVLQRKGPCIGMTFQQLNLEETR